MTYTVEYSPEAARALRRLERGDRQSAQRIAKKIAALADDPRPQSVEPVKSRPGTLRTRAGDYRAIYQVFDDRLLVLVIEIGHRSSIYD